MTLPSNDVNATYGVEPFSTGWLKNLVLESGQLPSSVMLKSVYDLNEDGIVDRAYAARQMNVICINQTNATIGKGKIVRIVGAAGDKPSIALADKSQESTSTKTFGITLDEIGHGATGRVAFAGLAENLSIPPNDYTAGQPLWLGDDGGWVTSAPTPTDHSVFIGWIAKTSSGNGVILLHIQNGYELHELHDVLIANPVNDHVLMYENGLWKNKSISGGLSGSGQANRLTLWSGDTTLSSNQSFTYHVDETTEAYISSSLASVGEQDGDAMFAFKNPFSDPVIDYFNQTEFALRQDAYGNTYLNGKKPTAEDPLPETGPSATDGLFLRLDNSVSNQLNFDGTYWTLWQDEDTKMSVTMKTDGEAEFSIYGEVDTKEGRPQIDLPNFTFRGPIWTEGSIWAGNNGVMGAGSAVAGKITKPAENGQQPIGGAGFAYRDWYTYTNAQNDVVTLERDYLDVQKYSLQQDIRGNTYLNCFNGLDVTYEDQIPGANPAAGRLYLRHNNQEAHQLTFDGTYWTHWYAQGTTMSTVINSDGEFEFNANGSNARFYFNTKALFEGDVDLTNGGRLTAMTARVGQVIVQSNPQDPVGGAGFAYYGITNNVTYDYLTTGQYAIQQDQSGNTYLNSASSGDVFIRKNNQAAHQLTFDGTYWTHWLNQNTKLATTIDQTGKFDFLVYGSSPKFYFNTQLAVDGDVTLANDGKLTAMTARVGQVIVQSNPQDPVGGAGFAYYGTTNNVTYDYLTTGQYALQQDQSGNTYLNAATPGRLYLRKDNSSTNQLSFDGSVWTLRYDASNLVNFQVTSGGVFTISPAANNTVKIEAPLTLTGNLTLTNNSAVNAIPAIMGKIPSTGDAGFAYKDGAVDYFNQTEYAVRQDAYGNTYVNAQAPTQSPVQGTDGLFLGVNNTKERGLNFDGTYWTFWYDVNNKMSVNIQNNGIFNFRVYGSSPKFNFEGGDIYTVGDIVLNNNKKLHAVPAAVGKIPDSTGDAGFAYKDGATDYFTTTNYAIRQDGSGNTYINAKTPSSVPPTPDAVTSTAGLALRVGNSLENQLLFDSKYWTIWRNSTTHMSMELKSDGDFNFYTYGTGPTTPVARAPRFYFNGQTFIDGHLTLGNVGNLTAFSIFTQASGANNGDITINQYGSLVLTDKGVIGTIDGTIGDGFGDNLLTTTFIGMAHQNMRLPNTTKISPGKYAFLQDSNGETYINAAATKVVRIRVDNTNVATFKRDNNGSRMYVGPDTDAAAYLHISSPTAAGTLQLPQLRLDRDSNNYSTVTVESDGSTTFTAYNPTTGAGTFVFRGNVSTYSGKTLTTGGLVLTGTVTANSSTGTSGQLLTTTGTGVQWSSNLYWDNVNSRLGVGTSSPSEDMSIVRYAAISTLGLTRVNGNSGSPTAVQSGENYGQLLFRGRSSDGNTYPAAFVSTLAETTPSGSAMYGQIAFGTSNTSSPATRMRLFRAGNLGIGTDTDQGQKLQVLSLTEQMRILYDVNNYYSTTVGSTGTVTFNAVSNAVGTSPKFVFSDAVEVTSFSLSGTLTAGGSTGTNGQVLTSTGTGVQWSSSGGTSIGGTVTSGTTGSILFVGSGPVLSQNNANLFWDNTNSRIGIRTASPATALHVVATSSLGQARFAYDPNNYFRVYCDSGGTTQLMSAGTFQTFKFAAGSGNTKIGVNADASAALHVVDTSEQLRIGYDLSNYSSFSVNSSGTVTFDAVSNAVGTSPKFVFSDPTEVTSLSVSGTLTAGGSVGSDGQVLMATGTGVKWSSSNNIQFQLVEIGDETTAITSGNSKYTFRIPYGFGLVDVRASLVTAQTSGTVFTVDVKKNGSSVFASGATITIDNNEKSSKTAASLSSIVASYLDDDSEMTVDVTQIGNGTAKGLKLYLVGYKCQLQDGLLNSYPDSAASAYSVRRLNKDYAGPAMKVRRTDNTTLDIGFTPDGELNTSVLLSFVGAGGDGFVDTWYDQNGQGRHATQSTSANQPKIVVSGQLVTQNSRPAILFTAANSTHLNYTGSFLASTKYSVFSAFARTSSSSQYVLGGSGSTTNSNLHFGFSSSTTLFLGQYGNDLSGTVSGYVSPRMDVLSGFNYSSGKAIRLNSSLVNSNSNTTNLGSYTGSKIGAYFTNYLEGKLSEVILYPSDQWANRDAIESNIKSYYSVT